MEELNTQLHSIWGTWWEPVRKWFYPLWLIYETSVRFYDYAIGVHLYFTEHQSSISSYIGDAGAYILCIVCSVLTFAICSAFLTLPGSYLLFKLFKVDNLTHSVIEEKLKPIF